jgi:hypothetical protein
MLLLNAWAAPAQTLSPSAFAQELQRLEAAVSAGAPGQVPDVRPPSAWTVEANGQRIDVPGIGILRSLDEARRNPSLWPARRAALLEHLRALQAEVRALEAQTAAAADSQRAARATLDEVLAAPEFQRLRKQSALARLRQRFSEWLLDVWERLGGAALGRRGTATAFAWIVAIAALIVLATAVVRLILRPARRAALAPHPGGERHPARLWARKALAAADPREALRYAYTATIYGLEEEGVWSADDSRTPREYLRLLPHDHRRRRLVADLTVRFEEIWFAAREATENDRALALAGLKELGCLPAD